VTPAIGFYRARVTFSFVQAAIAGRFRKDSRQPFHNHAADQGFGSMPMRSLTADRIRWLQPRWRSVV
jgi:hypothetical protein